MCVSRRMHVSVAGGVQCHSGENNAALGRDSVVVGYRAGHAGGPGSNPGLAQFSWGPFTTWGYCDTMVFHSPWL